jgi:threonine dehydrogenase-like Zn-dependent dehydrogenase
MVTHTYPLDEAATAFETATSKTGGAIKVLLDVST